MSDSHYLVSSPWSKFWGGRSLVAALCSPLPLLCPMLFDPVALKLFSTFQIRLTKGSLNILTSLLHRTANTKNIIQHKRSWCHMGERFYLHLHVLCTTRMPNGERRVFKPPKDIFQSPNSYLLRKSPSRCIFGRYSLDLRGPQDAQGSLKTNY